MAMTLKEESIREVIVTRCKVIDRIVKTNKLPPDERAFYLGKREGLMQAFSLLGENIESIRIELQ